MRLKLAKIFRTLTALLMLGSAFVAHEAVSDDGLIMVVGDVLPLKNQVVWRNLVRLAERKGGENLIIASAHDRPKLYGGFTQRAFQNYGKSAELLPLAEQFQEFSTDYRYLTKDAELGERVRQAGSVFFVGGHPQRLSKVLFKKRGKPTNLADALKAAYGSGSLIVGGIPGRVVVSTRVDPLHALHEGEIDEDHIHPGLRLLEHDWYIDQHYFGRGRFATSLVAMHQFEFDYGVGVGLDTAAVIHGTTVEVLGNRGVVTIDLTQASFKQTRRGMKVSNVKLNYLENGDRIEMDSGTVVPYSEKINGFEISAPGESAQGISLPASQELMRPGEMVRLMYEALDSKNGQALGYALHHDNDDEGFEFRFFTRADSKGWLSVADDQERFTLTNIYLDINPL